MNRWLRCLVAVAWVVVAPHAAAQSAGFDIEGKYEVLQPPQLTETGDRIEVVDVFWYGCPHCYTFLPSMEAYDSDQARVRRDSAAAGGVPRELGRPTPAPTTPPCSSASPTRRTARCSRRSTRHRNPTDHKECAHRILRKRQGVDRTEFEQTYDSFAVESMVRKSILMQQRYGITGTPSVVVNGKYPGHGPARGQLQQRDRGGDGARRTGSTRRGRAPRTEQRRHRLRDSRPARASPATRAIAAMLSRRCAPPRVP